MKRIPNICKRHLNYNSPPFFSTSSTAAAHLQPGGPNAGRGHPRRRRLEHGNGVHQSGPRHHLLDGGPGRVRVCHRARRLLPVDGG